MSTHIDARSDQIASTVLLPGDPLRAQYIAETFLTDVVQYNKVRNMLGFTGLTESGRRVSVQGSGMGMPSLSIYTHELIRNYGVRCIIRLGSCGSLRQDLHLRDIVLAMGSCSDSAINTRRFKGMQFAPIADWSLLLKAYNIAQILGIKVRVGNVVATDLFYEDADTNPEDSDWKLWAKYGVLAIDMETSELYTIAARQGIQALTILTVSDVLPTAESTTAREREKTFHDMVHLALEIF